MSRDLAPRVKLALAGFVFDVGVVVLCSLALAYFALDPEA